MSIIFVNGRRINLENNSNRAPKNKYLAAVLSLLGGMFGVHKLYLGDIGGFILFMFLFLFFTFSPPVTLFLGIFNALQLLNMSQQEFDHKYNGGYVQRGDSRIEKRREEQMRRYESEDKKRPYFEAPKRQRSNPFKSSGVAKYKDFDLDGAIEDFQKGLDIEPNDVSLNFNIACAYSLQEKKDEAFKYLARAVSLGFNDFERILTHDDLAFVRIQPEFDSFKQSGYRVYVGSKPAPTPQNTTTKTIETKTEEIDENLLAQLNRLAELRDRGILSEQEFLLEKKKLTRN